METVLSPLCIVRGNCMQSMVDQINEGITRLLFACLRYGITEELKDNSGTPLWTNARQCDRI